MRILIAPNAFKNSLAADEVAVAIRTGLQQSGLQCTMECFPVGDGGDGTGNLLLQKLKSIIVTKQVHDPLGRIIEADFGLIDRGKTAIIELANASGLRLLKSDELDPLHATTYGTGELMKHALDQGVSKIILCIGGSATVDGGTGILSALYVKFYGADSKGLAQLPADLELLSSIELSELDKRIIKCELIIMCDVTNPLLGDNGAAAVFGPQKGASVSDVQHLEACLSRFREVSLRVTGKDIATLKHGGVAGGTAAGLYAFLNAKLVDGIDYFLDITGFENSLQNVDLVITGEGEIDTQTLDGKAPFGVAKRAKEKDIPVIAMAGKIPLKPDPELSNYFDVLISINHQPMDLEEAIKNTRENLINTSYKLGKVINLITNKAIDKNK